jgi:Flp pilus assembly protein TadG
MRLAETIMKILSLKRYIRAESGVAAIEFSFILPFMLLLYFGLIDLTQLISLNRKVTSVAAATADLVTQNRNSIVKTDINDYFKISGMIMNPTPANDVTVKVMNYRKSGSTATLAWTVTSGTGSGCPSGPAVADILPLMEAGNDIVVAQACLPHTPSTAQFMGETLLGALTFNVEQTVMQRPRASLTLNCFATSIGGAAC